MTGSDPSNGVRRNPPRKSSKKSQSLPSIQENSRDPHISDEELLSADYHPDEERRAERALERATKNLSTPQLRKKSGSSTGSNQKKNACEADPNDGRCLLTNLPEAVQTCHLIAGSTDPKIVKQLEYAWGLLHGELHLDTRHNLVFLRADWHYLFDQKKWMLVPELDVLRELHRATVSAAPEDRLRIKLDKKFKRETYKYHLLPFPGLQGPICRFEDPGTDVVLRHTTLHYPFISLGPLSSHVKPHYVVFNSAQKLETTSVPQLTKLQSVLQQVSFHRNKDIAVKRLQLIFDLYQHWTTLAIPDDFDKPDSGNQDRESDADADYPPSETRSPSASDERDDSDDDSGEHSGEMSTPSKKQKHGRQHGDDDVQSTSTTESMESTVADENDWNSSEETCWIAEICSWAEHCTETASNGGWQPVLNDDQVTAYAKEPSCSAPPPKSWHRWRPSWEACEGKRRPFNTEKFSSNDWALYEEHSYLTWISL